MSGQNFLLSRRTFVVLGAGAATATIAGCSPDGSGTGGLNSITLNYRPVPQLGTPEREPFALPRVDMRKIPTQFHRQYVKHSGRYKPNTIIVDTKNRHLYYIQDGNDAIRYGIGVGRAGFAWGGRANIRRKAKWPTWTPPRPMIRRQPELKKWAGGMPGGPANPLGARALYLYKGGRDTLYRIHGTNEPFSIGQAMSSGCIRMLNKDSIDLYERVRTGATVVVSQTGAVV
ncbi:MAG: L,D-transpeptidase [Pseudomonadota bacterium]